MKNKPLKKWNGRAHGKYNRGSFFVAAYSQKQAAELISKAAYPDSPKILIGVSEIQNYYSPCWGNTMQSIKPLKPSLYWIKNYGDTPEKIL